MKNTKRTSESARAKIASLNAEIARLKEQLDAADLINGRSIRRLEYLEDTATRHRDWITQAKKDAGYHDNISFDVVWTEILAKAKAQNKA